MLRIRHARGIWLPEMWAQARRAVRQPLFAASILFAVILTVAGAFGTFRIVLPLRLIYWILMTFCAAGFLLAVDRFLGRTFVRAWAARVATVVVTAVPVALLSTAVGTLLLPVQTFAWRFLEFYPGAVVLNILLLALWRLTKTRDVIVEVATTALPANTVPPRIASKLPPRMARSRLLAVEAQDHYLRVATGDGDALVYMRFTDALEALEQSDGVRVHRSWWVARTSIDSMKFASGRGELTLVNGAVVPVSRRFASEVKQMARRSTP
ncbi:MAG TPA: LytTR family DNA-binding domain-containing protein [Allosphingosinicella sp.]